MATHSGAREPNAEFSSNNNKYANFTDPSCSPLHTDGSKRPDHFQRWYARGGEFFEQIITEIYRATVRRGDHVVDVGANLGSHTLPLARCVGFWGRVTAIEALPHLAAKLTKRTRWRRQIEIVNRAISRTEGRTQFSWVRRDEGWSGIRRRSLPPEFGDEVETIDLPQTTLDALLSVRAKPVSFIKIDVEGGEFDVIRGGLDLIAKDRPLIVFENGGDADAELYGYNRAEFFDVFRRLDYALFDLFGRPLVETSWDQDERPWYVIAVANDGAPIRLIKQDLRAMIEAIDAPAR